MIYLETKSETFTLVGLQALRIVTNVDMVVMVVFCLIKHLVSFNVVMPLVYLLYFFITGGIYKMSKEAELLRQSRDPTSNVIIIDKANFIFSSLYISLGFILI